MSLVEDQNRRDNEHNASLRINSAVEHMKEIERNRVASEACKNPLCNQFWERRKALTQSLRNKVLLRIPQ